MSLVVRDAAARNGNSLVNGNGIVNGNSLVNGNGNGMYADEGNDARAYNSPPSSFSSPKPPGVLERHPNGLADFFSTEVFQIVLHNPTTAHRLHKFSEARMCGENMEFLEKVCQYAYWHRADTLTVPRCCRLTGTMRFSMS